MKLRTLWVASAASALAGCGSFFESSIPAPQAYVLRLPAPAEHEGVIQTKGSVKVLRPEAGPGLDSEHIALLRSNRRFDFYAASRWAAAAPDLLEDVIVDRLRGTGAFSAVLDDAAPYAPYYNLRCGLARFEADYSSDGSGSGGHAPTVKVALNCTFGRHRDRVLLASFSAEGSAPASEDRLNAVVAAFEAATASALTELERHIASALQAEHEAAG
jgi:ABC-type uncharacterized transport system auxiliary subunit